jgi:hypothetical protein
VLGEFGFDAGDALVEESVVLARGLETFLKPLVVLRGLAQLVFQGGVFGDESLNGVFGEVEFKVTNLAEELPNAGPLCSDLGAGSFECALSVECPLFPGAGGLDCPAFLILGLQCWCLLGGCREEGAGCGVLVEERAGNVGFSELVMIMDLCGGSRGVEDSGDHQVDVVLVESGDGVTEIHRDSFGEAGRETQDSLFTSGAGQVAGVERGDGGGPVEYGHFGDAVSDAGVEVEEPLGEAVAVQEMSVVDEEIRGGFEAVQAAGLGA